MELSKPLNRIQSTAGAIPVRNEKGEFRMEKVKVTRYMPGRRPDYAIEYPSDSDSGGLTGDSDIDDDDDTLITKATRQDDLERQRREYNETEISADKRLARLRDRSTHVNRSSRVIEEPEIVEAMIDDEFMYNDDRSPGISDEWRMKRHISVDTDDESDNLSDNPDPEVIDKRRQMVKQKALLKREEEELLDILEEEDEVANNERRGIDSDNSSEYEEYTDSEDDIGITRLKPVFVQKCDRVTIRDHKETEEEQKRIEREIRIAAEKRKKHSTKMVAEAIAQELQHEQGVDTVNDVVNTDDENEEEEYEAWKIRELTRIKRDREEIENRQKEKDELDRLHHMTEEEKLIWLKQNPKIITNQQTKGKYRFLQKYYHRGVFYLDEEDDVLQRNFAQPTLEDHFDKTVLPKVMQVKDFGRAGRTKYTHLVDQDTTAFDSPWTQSNPVNVKYQNKGGGMKDSFEKPSAKRTKIS